MCCGRILSGLNLEKQLQIAGEKKPDPEGNQERGLVDTLSNLLTGEHDYCGRHVFSGFIIIACLPPVTILLSVKREFAEASATQHEG